MSAIPRIALVAAAQSMAVDQVTVEVVGALGTAGLVPILLKGPSIAQWLYPEGGRAYGDTDLLVSIDDFARAAQVLRTRGFSEALGGRASHALEFHRNPERGGGHVDLHRQLPHIQVPPEVAWQRFDRRCETIRVGGTEVRVLGVAHRALHIAIHVTQHGDDLAKPLEDLRRAIARVSEDVWRESVVESRALKAEDALGAGLNALVEGQRLAERLGVTVAIRKSLLVLMTPRLSETGAYTVQRILDAPSFAERWRLVVDVFFLSPVDMANVSRLARKGRTGLVLAYVLRPFQVVGRLVPALLARRRILKTHE